MLHFCFQVESISRLKLADYASGIKVHHNGVQIFALMFLEIQPPL